ncbi:MAG: tetratricopeptide repeat protein [Tenuifilum sp.]|uniref:tetratricopeptide repeat protein n=3 Tax=Tenuifilum sp. TaxID=2760880 RepID=UPI002BC6EE83|nr:tetratricopeptide repeat protein [Tenuifilum sp.]HRS43260.1 tetratricopeptide repeat protein [Tenuifilum sp.]
MMFKKILLPVYAILCLHLVAQPQNADSLLLQLYQESNDSLRVLILQKIARVYEVNENNPVLAENYLLEAKRLAESIKSNYLRMEVYTSLGVLYRNISNYANALKFHNDALDLAREIDDKHQQAKSLNNLGVVYRRLDNHAYASEYHLKALKLAEEIKDTFNISVACNSLGNIFSLNGRYDEALEYFQRALYLSQQTNNLLGQAMNFNNIGEVYEFKGDFIKAKDYYSKSLDINYQINSQKGIAINFNALGKIELYLGNPLKAQDYFTKALVIDKKLNDKKFIADSYINLARAQLGLNNDRSAYENVFACLSIAKEIKSLIHFQQAYEVLSDYYQKQNEYSKALEYFKLSSSYKDSVLNEKNSRHISTIQTLYETEKKENEIKLLLQQQELKQREITRTKIQTYVLLIGLLLSGAMLLVIYFALRDKRRTAEKLARQLEEIELKNVLLEEKNQEIEQQKQEIEKNKDFIEQKNKNLEEAYNIIESYIQKITDSIRYAERIQESIQPPISFVKKQFSDTFIFSRPKDIVSGDFYWMLPKGNKVFFALADCTGHGVPGAFMSIIGIDLINQAVNQHMLYKTDDILSFIDDQLIKRLSKSKNEMILKDSMDIAVCVFDKETYLLEYTSALIPLFLQRNGDVQELKPDFVTLGAKLAGASSKNFTVKSIKLTPGDWLYLTSDGYFDQLGGDNHKKFMRSRFKEQLVLTSGMDGVSKCTHFEKTFLSWMKRNEQIDDVLLWGIKF